MKKAALHPLFSRSLAAVRQISRESSSCPRPPPASAKVACECAWSQPRMKMCESGQGSLPALYSVQAQVWLLAERCRGAPGVLIGGKWHDAQSQQRIIYLAHLWKLLKRLMHRAFWKPRGSPSTEAKLSHLVAPWILSNVIASTCNPRRAADGDCLKMMMHKHEAGILRFRSAATPWDENKKKWTTGAARICAVGRWSVKSQNIFLSTLSKRKTQPLASIKFMLPRWRK